MPAGTTALQLDSFTMTMAVSLCDGDGEAAAVETPASPTRPWSRSLRPQSARLAHSLDASNGALGTHSSHFPKVLQRGNAIPLAEASPRSSNNSREAGSGGANLTGTPPSRSKSLGKRFKRTGSKEDIRMFTEEMDRLERVLDKSAARNALVKALVSEPSNVAVKVRFCGAVSEYDKCHDKSEKRAKARKIVSTFVVSGGMFEITTLPPAIVKELLGGNFKSLVEARSHVVEELSRNPAVLDFISKSSDASTATVSIGNTGCLVQTTPSSTV